MFDVGKLRDRLKKVWPSLFEADKPSRCIYHYTTYDVYEKIVSANALYSTHFLDLNDVKEFDIGFDYALGYLERRFGKESGWGHVRSSLLTLKAELRKASKLCLSCPWITSFTDAEDSIHHWMAYTDRNEGGVAIGFDETGLSEFVSAFNGRKCASRTGLFSGVVSFLCPCFYCESVEKADPRLDSILDILFEAEAVDCSADDAAERIYFALVLFASFTKHSTFAWEREWRLVTMNCGGVWNDDVVRIVGGKLRVAFGLEDPMPIKGLIRSLLASPHGSTRNYRHLIGRGVCNGVKAKIRRSHLPYCGGQ